MSVICVDVMGSDKSPEVVLEGVRMALEKDQELEVLLAGNEEVVSPFVACYHRAKALITTEVIGMGEHPANAVRQKKDASIVRAAQAVKSGDADGLFSAGSTGAVLTAATFGIGRIKGIKRPALALIFPGLENHRTVFLDTGANADVRPEVLVQFAQMGSAYACASFGVQEPKIGLLCNGSEETKGSELALSYHAALVESGINFVGNAEGTDILGNRFDVIVTDGFTGNVALKSIESTGKYILSSLKTAVSTSKKAAFGALLLKDTLKVVSANLSGDEVGGAVLLGVSAPVFKGHGATSSSAVCAGVLSTASAVQSELVKTIASTISL